MAETPPAELGWPAPDFTLPGVDGKAHTLSEIAGPNGTVIVFICNHCPYVKAITERLSRTAEDLKAHGIVTIAINSNDAQTYPDDSFDNMVRFAKENRFKFSYLHDEDQSVARAYGAVCTPDFFGFDKHLKLAYRGRLDEGRRDPPAPGAPRELHDAMVAVAETGKVPGEQNPSIGCSIKWKVA